MRYRAFTGTDFVYSVAFSLPDFFRQYADCPISLGSDICDAFNHEVFYGDILDYLGVLCVAIFSEGTFWLIPLDETQELELLTPRLSLEIRIVADPFIYWPHRYREKFKNVDPAVIKATERLLQAKPYKAKLNQRQMDEIIDAFIACNQWLGTVSDIYHLIKPKLVVKTALLDCYIPKTNTIQMGKFSIFTLLHEFRHAWQYQKNIKPDDEDDARGWSASLVYLTNKKFYQNAVDKGLIYFS